MTKEITKAFILQQLQDKFKLREFDKAQFLFDETVVPIYDIREHLLTQRTGYTTKNVTGTGGILCFQIPDNERWTFNGYNVVFLTGAYTVAGVYITRVIAGPASFLYLDLTAGQNTSYAVNLPKPLVLDSGDTLNINIDGYTGAGSIRLYIDYTLEEIR